MLALPAGNDVAAIKDGDATPAMRAKKPQTLAAKMRLRVGELDNLVYVLPLRLTV